MEGDLQKFPDSSKKTVAASASQESPAMNLVKIFGGKKFILKENEDKSSFFILTTKDYAKQQVVFLRNLQRPLEFTIILKHNETDSIKQSLSVRAVLRIPPSYDNRYHYSDIQDFQIEVRFPKVSTLRNTIPGYMAQSPSPEGIPGSTPLVLGTSDTEYEPVNFRTTRARDPLVTPQGKRIRMIFPERPRKSNISGFKYPLDEDDYDTGSPKPSQKRRRAPIAVQPSRKSRGLENPKVVGTNETDLEK